MHFGESLVSSSLEHSDNRGMMGKMGLLLIFSVLSALALAGCSTTDTPSSPAATFENTPAPIATSTPAQVTPGPSVEAVPSVVTTVTPTPVPTATVTPSPTPIPTPTPTVVPTPTPTATAIALRCGDSGLPEQIVSGPDGPEGADADSVFRAFEVHPTDPDVIFLGTERNGFVKSVDGGRTWVRLRQGLKTDGTGYAEVWDIAISPSDPQTMVAATLGSPGPITGPHADSGIYWSTDGGQSWTQMNCGLPSSRVTSVAFDLTDSSVAIAGLEGGFPSYTGDSNYYPGGLFRTTDSGQTWTRVSAGGAEERNGFWVMKSAANDPGMLITFGMNFYDLNENLGFLRSTDSGRSWTPFAETLRNRMITSFSVSPDGQVIYTHERDTYRAWVSKDSGVTWSQSAIIQVNGPIAVSPADREIVIFGNLHEIRRSINGLQTVKAVTTAAQPPGYSSPARFQQIAFAPSNPSVVYAVTGGYLVYRSTDSGTSFELMANVRSDVLNAQP